MYPPGKMSKIKQIILKYAFISAASFTTYVEVMCPCGFLIKILECLSFLVPWVKKTLWKHKCWNCTSCT